MVTLPGRAVLALLIVSLFALAFVPVFADTFYLKLVTRMLIMAIFAMSLDLLIGYTGLVSFGHAAFFGLAAYSLQLTSPEYEAANVWTTLPLTLAITAVAAAVIGALSVRTKGIYFIMVTLAFAQMFFYFFHDSPIAGGSDGAFIFVKPVLTLPFGGAVDFEDRAAFFYVTLAALVFTYVALVVILRSPFGQVIQGIKVNEHRMRALGYNTYLYKLVSFIIAGTFAGLAGYLFACIDGFVAPALLGWTESGIAIMLVLLGGIGTLFGSIYGAIAFISMEEIFKEAGLVGSLAKHWLIPMGLFIIVAVLLLPRGIGGLLMRLDRNRSEAREP